MYQGGRGRGGPGAQAGRTRSSADALLQRASSQLRGERPDSRNSLEEDGVGVGVSLFVIYCKSFFSPNFIKLTFRNLNIFTFRI